MAITKAPMTAYNGAPVACQPVGNDAGAFTDSPVRGSAVCPMYPITTNATHDSTVNPTTHTFRLRRASEIAPRNGIAANTKTEATPFPTATNVFDDPRSLTSQTV